ncbi:hypothetical protein HYE69_02215 [Staphylococcus sp. GSSP0090]|nr:hypothetical protein [Staphylococcus sp. GSSP0090]
MAITLLIIVLIVNMAEALYLLVKFMKLKQNNASDRAYKQMIDKLSPLMWASFALSIVLLIIAGIVS